MAAFTESDWAYYRVLTIDNTKVAATMPDGGESGYPVDIIIDPPNSINDDTSDLATTFFDNYTDTGDLCFTANPPGANTLPHGIKRVVTTNGSEYLAAAVYIPSIAGAVDTTVRMYYASALGDQQNKAGVYPVADNWVDYWPLEEDAAGTGNVGLYNDWCGTSDGDDYVSGGTIAGQVGNCPNFDGSDYIQAPDNAAFDIARLTMMCWAKPTTAATSQFVVGRTSVDAPLMYYFWLLNSKIRTRLTTTGAPILISSTTPWSNGVWQHAASTYAGDSIRQYYNGAPDGVSVALTGNLAASARPVDIGRYAAGNSLYFTGGIDELSISGVARSANWILTTYNCQSDNDAFWSVGAEVVLGGITYNQISGGLIIFGGAAISLQAWLRILLEGYPTTRLLLGKPLARKLLGYPTESILDGKPK